MAKNTRPAFTKTGRYPAVAITAANTSSQGNGTIGTDIFLIGTAGADGTYVDHIRLVPTASTPTTTTATVARAFISTQSSGATTSANTTPIGQEITLPATAAANASAAAPYYVIPIGFVIESGMSLLVTNHAAPAANTAWKAIAIGGDF